MSTECGLDMGWMLCEAAGSREVLETLKFIKQVILEEAERLGVSVARVVLFGSRARGDCREDSDYDVLVVVEGEIDRETRRLLSARISARVARRLLVPVDVIVTTRRRWREYADVVGTIEEAASHEGVTI